jgi:hypothetical protein
VSEPPLHRSGRADAGEERDGDDDEEEPAHASDVPFSVIALDIADGVVTAVRSIVNPDKLRHVRPLQTPRSDEDA